MATYKDTLATFQRALHLRRLRERVASRPGPTCWSIASRRWSNAVPRAGRSESRALIPRLTRCTRYYLLCSQRRSLYTSQCRSEDLLDPIHAQRILWWTPHPSSFHSPHTRRRREHVLIARYTRPLTKTLSHRDAPSLSMRECPQYRNDTESWALRVYLR